MSLSTRARYMEALQKPVALVLSFFLVWLSPGIGCYGVLAASAGYSTYYYDNDRKEYVEVGKVLPALLRRILDNPQVHWRPEEREKLIGAVRRLEAGMGAAPDERTKIINQVNNLARRLEKPDADSEHLLADFYSSVANFAKKTEEEWTASTNQTYTFADQTKTYFDRSYNAITGTWTRDRYVRPLSDELQQVVIYEPDPKKPEKKVVSTVARIFDDGMRQEQKVHYSRQYCSMLEDLNQAFKSRGDVPDLVVEYIGKCRDADKTGHYDRLSPEEFERVQTVAQKYYLDNELAQFEKARALSKVQYYVGKWNMPKNPLQKSADDELDVNSLSYEKIQQTLSDLEAGKIPTLSWFGRAIARYSRMQLPDELRRPLNRVQRYLDYALDAKERAFEPGISEEARSARIEEVEEWMKFAQQQFLIFQLGSMKENVQKLSQGQPVLKGTYRIFGQEIPSATSALDKFASWLNREQKLTDPQDQAAADNLAEQEQRLAAHLEEMEAKSRATLVKVTAASLGKSLWEARFGYLADEDVRKQVTLSRDRAEALRVLSERGDPQAARALASVIAQLDEARRKKDVSQARLGEIQRAWEGLPAVWAGLGFSGMPDFEQTEKERLQMKVYQANLTYSADKMSLYMQSFASTHQFDMGGTEYLTSGNWIKSAQDWAGMPRGWWTPEKGVKQRFAEWSMKHWDEFRGKKSYRALKEIWPKHRHEILGSMRQGRYNDAMEKFIALDPGAADAALAKFRKTNSAAPRPTDIVGVLTQGISSETGVKLDGVAQKQFEHLSEAAKTYMFASAAFDMVTTAAAMYAAAPAVVRGMKTAATGARLVGIKAAGRAAASGRVAAALWRSVGFGADKAYRYFGGVGLDMANMAKLTLPSRQMGAVAALKNAYQPVHFLNILKAYSLQTGIIGGASAGISAATHKLSPETSPYKSGADAAIEGAAGGASWAAQWGWMFMLQPIKLNMLKPGSRLRTLFERGWSDLASQYAAKGGIWLSRRYLPEGLQVTGKTVAGRAMIASAEQGPVQALAGQSMALQMPEGVLRSLQKGPIPLVGPVYRSLTGVASFGWGMIDGISRYMAAGVAAQNVFEAVGYGVSRAVERDAPGDSSHAGALARGQRWGQAAAEWSFLAVPTGVQGRSDWIAEAKNEGKILIEIIRQNREGELFRMEEGDPLKVTVKDWRGRPVEIKGTFNSGMLAAVLDARSSKEPGKILDLYAQARSRGQDYEAIDIPVLPKPQTEAKPGGPGAKPAPSPAPVQEKTVQAEAESKTALTVPLTPEVFGFIESQAKELLARDPKLARGIMENAGSTPEMKTLAANALADYPGLSPASDPLWRGESFLSTPRKRAVTLLKRQLSSEAEKNLEARVQERLRELFGGRSEKEARQNPLIVEKVRKFLEVEKSEITLVKDLKDIEKFTRTQVPTPETMKEAQKAAGEIQSRGPPLEKSEIRESLSLQPQPPPEGARIIKPGEAAPGAKEDLILPGQPPSEAPRIIKPGEPAAKPAAIEPSRASETSPAARTVEEIFREAKSIIRAQELKAVADAKFDAYAAGSGLNAPEKLALRHLRDSIVADVISEHAADRFVRGVLHGQASSDDVFDYMVLQTEVLKSLKIPDITGFRENQKSLYLNFLEMLQEAKAKGVNIRDALLAYLLLETGGGKTLLSFLGLIPLAEALSRELHLEGTIFATLSDLLKYQAIEDYKSYFSGKSPSFEILSYSDLNSRKLMAAMTGDYSPYETHVIIADELDGLALQPPISMGKDNGRIGAANPLYQVYHRLYGEILSGALRKLRGEDLETALDGLAQKYAAEAQRVYAEMKSGPHRKEAEQVFSVAKRQFGGAEPYWKETVRNLHEAALIAEPSRVMEVDGEKGKMLPVHHGSIYATLDTPSRNFFELKNNFDLTLPYDHVETTNFRSVMEEARYLIGLSGTLPSGMLPFLQKLNMIVRGRATQGHDSRLVVSRAPMDTVTTLTREALRVENANGGKNFVGIVVNSMRELRSVEEALIRSGVSAKERIAWVYPGMTYWKEIRYQAGRVAKESNLAAMEKGEAEVVLIVSETGGRGWNPKLKKYRGTVTMIKMYPEEYASVTRNQVEGRFDVGRLHAEARARYVDLVGRDKFASNPEVREIALKSAQSAVEISAPQTKDRAAALKKLEAEDPVAYAFIRAANAKKLQRAVKDAREGNWTRLDKLVSNPIVAARLLKRVQQKVEDRVLREALSPPADARNRALLPMKAMAGQLAKKSVLFPMGGSMAAYWLTQSLVASSMTFPFSLLAPIGASMAAGQALRYFFKEKPSEKAPQEGGVGT